MVSHGEEEDAREEQRPVNVGQEEMSSEEEVEVQSSGVGHRTEQSSVMRELMEEEKEEPGDQVKEEPGVKEEEDGDGPSNRRAPGQGQLTGVGQEYDSEEYEVEESEEEYEEETTEDEDVLPSRSPSGFIPRYSGPEVTRKNRPAFGWSWSTQQVADVASGYRSAKEGNGEKKIKKAFTVQSHPSGPSVKKKASASTKKTISVAKGRSRPSKIGLPAKSNPVGNRRPAVVLNPYGLSTLVSNAVKVLPMFYSDTATVEKARDFWDMFATHTEGLPDKSRLLVFRQKLKGQEAERWWGNSSIKTFETLKLRFHNQFLSRTADELWNGWNLRRGSEASRWRSVSDLCETLNYPNPQMRYQLFRRGLRNKRMLATLDSSTASDIPEACEWLMFKDMYRPVEEDDQFSDTGPSKKKEKDKESPVLASVDALALQLHSFMDQQQLWQQQKQVYADQYQPPRSPRNRSPVAAATVSSLSMPSPPQGVPRCPRGKSMADDNRTQERIPVCGRCNNQGHGRGTCKRQTMNCLNCGEYGHIRPECESASRTGASPAPMGQNRSINCYFCGESGHIVANCPLIQSLRALTTGAVAGGGTGVPRQ